MKSMTIGKKIISLSAVLIALCVVLGGVAYFGLTNISTSVEEITGKAVPGLIAKAGVTRNLYMLRGNCLQHVVSHPADLPPIERQIQDNESDIRDEIKKYQELSTTAEDRQTIDRRPT